MAAQSSMARSGIGGSQVGSIFRQFTTKSGAPNAPIKPPKVQTPNRADFGGPAATPTIGMPNRGDYGLGAADVTRAQTGLNQAAGEASSAATGFRDPTHTGAFQNLMGLAGEQTAAQASEVSRHAKDASSRRGYSGGFEDTARGAQSDRMSALASAGFAGAESVRAQEGEQYGRAIGAFTALQDSYNQAMVTGNTEFARDLTQTRIEQAHTALGTMDLNQRQQLAYADSLNQARQLQAQLDEAYNHDLIDNRRYIQEQGQVAAQLQAQLAALTEHQREFDISAGQSDRELSERKREFDLNLKANPNTALRTFAPNGPFVASGGARGGVAPGGAFTGLA